MWAAIKSRFEVVRLIWDHPWVKIALSVWAICGAYDLLLNQFIPESVGQKFPRVRDFIVMTSGWLPWWGWLLGAAVIATVAAFEYAVRRTPRPIISQKDGLIVPRPITDQAPRFLELLGQPPLENEWWSSLSRVAADAREQNRATPYGRSIQTKEIGEQLADYAGRISNLVELHGVPMVPGATLPSEPIIEKGNDIRFWTNGPQMGSTNSAGKWNYRYIHMRSAEVPRVLAMIRELALAAAPTVQASSTPIIPITNDSKNIVNFSAYSRKKCFDYSENSGNIDVEVGSHKFILRFGRCDERKVYFYRTSDACRICKIRGTEPGTPIDFNNYHPDSDHYDLAVGEHFIVRNESGAFLQGRILSIKCEGASNADNDEVCFAYSLDLTGTGKMMAL